MLDSRQVEKPKVRGKLRKFLGKRFYIFKRRIEWLFHSKRFSKSKSELLDNVVIAHNSILLRPLKDVDMQYQYNKVTNLQLAIDKIDKIIIAPGMTFSLWYLVGKPSRRKGYLKGLVLNSGEIGYDYGGGLCQLGNLLYWMLLHTPLTITERWRHGYDVFPDVNRKLPFGSGATLAYNYIDLQFKNTTKHTYQLHLFLSEERLNGEILSEQKLKNRYEVYEDFHLIKHQLWGGYTRHNRLKRKIFDIEGNLISDDIIVENHAIMMYEPLLESGKII